MKKGTIILCIFAIALGLMAMLPADPGGWVQRGAIVQPAVEPAPQPGQAEVEETVDPDCIAPLPEAQGPESAYPAPVNWPYPAP